MMTSSRMTEKADRIERAIMRPRDDTAGEDGTAAEDGTAGEGGTAGEDGTAAEDGIAGEDGTGGRAWNWGSEVITSIIETQNEDSNHSQSRVYAHSI